MPSEQHVNPVSLEEQSMSGGDLHLVGVELPAPIKEKVGWPWTEAAPRLPEMMPNGKPWPRISIVTPSYNQGQFIEMTIRSILLQGYPNLEYIIIDGGSTDETLEIIRKYEKWITYWVREPDRGQAHAINKGFDRATGDILAWLNSDDLYLVSSFQAIVRAYLDHPDSSVFVGTCRRVDKRGRLISIIPPKNVTKQGILEWGSVGNFCQQACFFTRDVRLHHGQLDESLNLVFDYDFWLKIVSRKNVVIVPSEIGISRVHEQAKTQMLRSQLHVETFAVLVRHGYTDLAAKRLNMLIKRRSLLRRALIKIRTKVYRLYLSGRLFLQGLRERGTTLKQ